MKAKVTEAVLDDVSISCYEGAALTEAKAIAKALERYETAQSNARSECLIKLHSIQAEYGDALKYDNKVQYKFEQIRCGINDDLKKISWQIFCEFEEAVKQAKAKSQSERSGAASL